MPVPQLNAQSLPDMLELIAALNQSGFLLISPVGEIEYATANVAGFLCWEEEKLPGADLTEVIGVELGQKLLSAEGENWVVIEHKIPCSGKESLDAQLSVVPFRDRLRQNAGFLMAVTPLSPPEGRERFSSMGELAASIAHEIRNPLAAILTTAETMREDFDVNDSRREYLERIITEINRVNLFLVKFLALARPQKPQLALGYLPEVVDSVLHLEYKEIERYKIQVIREYEPGLPKILFDPHQMHQVFLNLILNAIQSMPNGGILKLAVKSDKTIMNRPRYIQVEITDNGSGIDSDAMKKIFTPFFSTKPKGVGLGLSVSQQIIKRHQGQIQVKSKQGEGTTFTLILPLRCDNQ
ncbi:MAG: hypothetical protein HZA78_10160 [Candidatus Schekmanbacteria bacterium]|nr:hypothetical protein [Candidatus Schekmanbacteria bacterium]